MSKREAKFTTELKHSFDEAGVFIHKIADMPHTFGARFDLKKPFDLFGVVPGILVDGHSRAFAIEAKAQKKGAFNFSCLRDNQIEGLTRWERSGGAGFVFLNVRDSSPRMNRLYVFQWKHLHTLIQCDHKSIKWASSVWKGLEDYPHIEGHGERYDFDQILDHMFNGGIHGKKGTGKTLFRGDL